MKRKENKKSPEINKKKIMISPRHKNNATQTHWADEPEQSGTKT